MKKYFLYVLILIIGIQVVYASCGPCGSTISASCTLDSDLFSTGTCFTIQGWNIVVDGNGYKINGDGTGDGVKIQVAGIALHNVTLRDLIIQNFSNGMIV